MKPIKVMWIAGEPSGDRLASELAVSLRRRLIEYCNQDSPFSQPLFTPLEPLFFGAGGDMMAKAGIKIVANLARHAVIGPWDAIRNLKHYYNFFSFLKQTAFQEVPDLIICVDFSGFNIPFATAIKNHIRRKSGSFLKWSPRIVQYVSPQVWASRPWRAKKLAENIDLLLSIFPFEKDWYAKRVSGLRVEFVGHPIIDRYDFNRINSDAKNDAEPQVLLLPGSRVSELRRHLPVMIEAGKRIKEKIPQSRFSIVFAEKQQAEFAQNYISSLDVTPSVGGLAEALQKATIAIASTGTVTLECAVFGVPTVAIYKTSLPTYALGRLMVTVNYLAMPNILAKEEIFPEFIQHKATPENIANSAIELISNNTRRAAIKAKLLNIRKSLGDKGAIDRAADAIMSLLPKLTPLQCVKD